MKKLSCIIAAAMIFASPAIAMAEKEVTSLGVAKGFAANFIGGNLTPEGRQVALSLLFVAMTSVWLFSSRKARAFTTVFGPVGLFLAIFNVVASVGVIGWASFLWGMVASFGFITGIVLLLIVLYLIQNFALKMPGYLVSSVKDIMAMGRKNQGVNNTREPWAWIIIGGITIVGFIISPRHNVQSNFAPLIISGVLCAFTIFSYFFRWKKGRWPWQKVGGTGDTTQSDPTNPAPTA